MNLEEIVKNNEDATPLSVEWKGEVVDFFMRPIMGLQQQELLEALGGVLSVNEKLEQAQKEDKQYMPTGEDLVEFERYKAKQVFILLCNKQGVPLFKSLKQMLSKLKPDLIRLIGDEMDKKINEGEKEDAEKN